MLQQAEPSDTKERMENINHVPGSICESTSDRILIPSVAGFSRSIERRYLTMQYELCKSIAVNPMKSVDHG